MDSTNRRRIAVVTDSTADLPQELVRRYDVYVIPQTLIMDGQTWQDGVDITPAAFYELLRTSSHFPSTSQATVAQFEDLFRQAAQGVDGVAAVLLASTLSGTINSARLASANLPHLAIEIVDTQGASMQQGFIVLAAARAAAEGADLHTVARAASDLVGRVHVFFVVDTLEYVHRGGRIGMAARLVGTALRIKPVLELRDGVVQPLARIRTRQKALEAMYDLVAGRLVPGAPVHIAVLHVAAAQEGQALARELERRFHPVEMIFSECSPVIGAHVGPGTVGVAFYQD